MAIHPASIDPEKLLEQCDVTRGRASGPGGQHRNKVETAVTLIHRPTQVVGYAAERRSLAEIQATFGLERYTNDTDSLLPECDFVSIHLPATPDTRHFINAHRLKLFKPGASLVNTARGSVVDETALYDALNNGALAGAALDVFAREPYEPVLPGKDLRLLANVLLTPHISSNTREANQRMAEACVANVVHFFAGNLERLTQVKQSL